MSMSAWRWYRWPNRATSMDGSLRRIEDGVPVLSAEDARGYWRVDDGIEDDVVDRAVRSVQDILEPPQGWLGRALTTATYRMTLPHFADRIVLSAPPFDTLNSFKYLDVNGDEKEVDESLYRIVESEPAEIVLERNKHWPHDVDCTQPDAVRIEYTAGYGAAEDVPALIQQWMLYQGAQFYDIRQPVVVGTSVSETPFIRNMLESYRVKL